jgi:hypothetical protein
MKLLFAASEELTMKAQREAYPLGAVNWIQANHPQGNLFNEYAWGGYLTWALREYPVFVDGRTDLYGDELLRTYLQTQAGKAGWQDSLNRFRINLVLVPVESGLAGELQAAQGWSPAYRDELSILYLRDEKMSSYRPEVSNE